MLVDNFQPYTINLPVDIFMKVMTDIVFDCSIGPMLEYMLLLDNTGEAILQARIAAE